MRFRGRRLLGVLAFSLFLLPGLPGCSGGQQDEEGLQASDDNSAGNAADENGSGGDKAADDNGGGGDNNAAADDDGGTASGDGSSNSTENDLQEIITEMNGQNGSGSGAEAGSGDAALPQNTAQAPGNTGAQPANAGNPAPNAKAAPEAKTAEAPAATPPPFQPGGSPAGKNIPELGSKMAYVVQKGDTLAKISQKIYGSNARWNELATLSGIPNPSRIFPGDLIYYTLDESAVTFASAYEGVQRSEEHVKQGDTLATIAKRVYGNPNAWRAIWRENDRIDNPDVIPPGTSVYYVAQGAAAAALDKLQAEMAKLALVKTAKGVNLTTKATVKGSLAVAKNNVVSNVKHAKVQKNQDNVLLADSQYFHGAADFGTNEGNRLVVFN